MKLLSKYFLICVDQTISKMDEGILKAGAYYDHSLYDFGDDTDDDFSDDTDDDFSDDTDDDFGDDTDDDFGDDTDDDFGDDSDSEYKEINFDYDTNDVEEVDDTTEVDDTEADSEIIDTDGIEIGDYSESEEDEDEDDDIHIHHPISDDETINQIINNYLFAFSTKDDRRVALDHADWSTIAKLSEVGMDRIFLCGKEVFVSGFRKISVKTESNLEEAIENAQSRGMLSYAERIKQLRC